MPTPTKAYAAKSAQTPLEPFTFERRDPGPRDVAIDIDYCGICHSDLHQARNEWGGSTFPMVPGHEIAGRVARVGSAVTRYKPGDRVGVGCFVDSCRECEYCKRGDEQYCQGHLSQTYNSTERDQKTPTQGGYSTHVVVDENYIVRIPDSLPLEQAAPLLCAGITTYSPMNHWKIGRGHKVGVVGLGGLGHMAVKIAAARGAEVTVLSHSPSKEKDAKRLGAAHFAATKDESTFKRLADSFDFILDTVSAPHDLGSYLSLLKIDGTMILLGAPDKPSPLHAFALIPARRQLAGSLIGGIKETQEMLDFCAAHKLGADIEVIPASRINEAYERMLHGDVKYRFVIDAKSLR